MGMTAEQRVALRLAESPADIAQIRELFHEYAESVGFSICFQNFQEELASVPGDYASPSGRLLLATCDGEVGGCGALRPLTADICEMKRLYVRPRYRGRSLGCTLTQRLMDDARSIGYTLMRLDTISPRMPEANRLYRKLGFYEIPSGGCNPQPEVTCMEFRLR